MFSDDHLAVTAIRKKSDHIEYDVFAYGRIDPFILATAQPAHQEIINLGQPAVPLILERMRSQGGHWVEALRQITGADPIPPDDRGEIEIIQRS